MINIIPSVKIEPNGITITNSYYYDCEKHSNNYDRYENLKQYDNSTYSNFSLGSRMRLKRAFLLLHSITDVQKVFDPILQKNIRFQLNMITLTLSARQELYNDRAIKQILLNDFLTRLRQNKGLSHYIWRAEPQKKK